MVGGLVAEIVFVLVLSLAVVSHALSSKSEPRPPALDALLHPRVLTTAGFVVLLLAGALSIRPRIGSGLWNGAIAATISRDGVEDLPDGLHVGLAGTGAPMPDSKRVGQSTFVLAGDHLFIVDSGPGSTLNLELMRVPLEETEAVLLTHFHSDHIAGLGELMLKSWTNGARTEPLRVMGPAGVEGVVDGFNQAFRLDAQ